MRGQSPLSAVDRRKADWVNDYDDLSNSKPSAVPPNISYPAFDNPTAAENNILFHRQLRDKVKRLKDKADIPPAENGQLSIVHGKNVLAVNQNLARCWRVQSTDHIQQCTFTRTGFPDDCHILALWNRKADIL